MKLTRIETKRILTVILAFHMTSIHVDASHDEALRILIVGIRGQSRFSAADLLSGRKDGGQEDREIVKTPVITDEGRMMLVTGPNLCEEDTARQTFTTALFLSSPGPHAVLMVLENQQSQQCDIVKRAQELLGEEVLQYCIVLLLQNHQEHLTGASREMINACGGRFHVMGDSKPKPAEKAALLAEVDKLVWLRTYSVLTQKLETEKLELLQRLQEIENKLKEETNRNINDENPVLSVIYDTSGGVGTVGWIFFIVLSAVVIFTKGKHELCSFGAVLCVFAIFLVILRNNLSPNVAVPINMTLCTLCVITTTCIRLLELNILFRFFVLVLFILGLPLGLILGTVTSIKTWSDVLIACSAAPGVTLGAILTTVFCTSSNQKNDGTVLNIAFQSFLFCSLGAMLSMGLVTVFCWMFTLLGVKMTTTLAILGFTTGGFHYKMEMFLFAVFILIVPCCCVFIGSVILVL
ncbi:uncharacterized protein LOC127156670 [Labeo rohita]|uniref:uncharacterized protein LOC127156670 n=1 Tax=Labeo rohita TaxID=84645 RepID=UPI0021E279DD|nr:uncharacterized protein LOC127156670 [Labeo rohita]